ncbi:MAG: 50S ribosomal protein L9 [Firmicutes bacterium]|nr:50S ribosomal protein L9 [Bacillota bacterium]
MQVILKKDVKGQGQKGQMVNVSDGYARNYLLPRGLAEVASKANINVMKGKQESLEYKKKKELEEANAIADKLKEVKVVIKAKAGDNGKLFGSVTSKDVAEALTMQHHIKLDKKKFVMPDGIKALGTTVVDVKIYTGVTGKLSVVVEQM